MADLTFKYTGTEIRTLAWEGGRLVFPGQNFPTSEDRVLNYDVPGLYEPADPATKKAVEKARADKAKAEASIEADAIKQAEQAAVAHLATSQED